MKDPPTEPATRPYLSSVCAQLFVADVPASCAFYTKTLGFTTDFVYGDPAFFAQVSRDAARLSLRFVDEAVFVGDIRAREHLLSAQITVANPAEIKKLFLEFKASGVRFFQALKKEPWGARTFIVLPDGNLVLFAGPAE